MLFDILCQPLFTSWSRWTEPRSDSTQTHGRQSIVNFEVIDEDTTVSWLRWWFESTSSVQLAGETSTSRVASTKGDVVLG